MQWVVLMAARLLIPRSLAEESRVASALTLKVIMGEAVPLYVEWILLNREISQTVGSNNGTFVRQAEN
jgi:hypothetical protein